MASSYSSSAAASGSHSSSGEPSADSYIGSLISLTSKSEIRYEGVLVSISSQESTIALRDVRSYGTEGRKKDGPQVPPNHQVYEYILFRGSDIKDLQVKPYPTPKPYIHNDPAIIRSNDLITSSSGTAAPAGVTQSDLGLNVNQSALGHPGISDALPAHQSRWSTLPASSNAVPMYWPGCYGGLTGLPQTHLQSDPSQSSSILLDPHAPQNQLIYPIASAHSNASSQSCTEPATSLSLPSSTNLPQFSIPNLTGTQFIHSQDILSSQPRSFLSSDLLPSSASISIRPTSELIPSIQLPMHSSSSVESTSGSLSMLPPLLTPDQLIHMSSQVQKLYVESKGGEALLPTPSLLSSFSSSTAQASLLPLPVSAKQPQQSATQYNEEFDFSAMNEKFNKDEVWGSLGKARQSGWVSGDDPIDGSFVGEGVSNNASNFDRKPVYNKDDFFDTLSCNSLNRGAWTGRPRFTERMRRDTETFGDFPQNLPSGRGTRRPAPSWNSRAYHHERGFGYHGSYSRGDHTFF